MADIELTRTHSMGLGDGREAVERVAQQLESDLEVDYQWDGDTLRFDGAGADGAIEVEADAVRVAINLSAFLQPLRGRIEDEAAQYLDRHLDGA
jgi:putative polyhydroxyalkanoate system protein